MKYRTYPLRWFILFIFCALSFSNNLNWSTYSPVQSLAIKYFNVGPSAINWMSLVYMLFYIPGCIIANSFLDFFGLRAYVCLGALLQLLGSFVRILGTNQFAIVLVGQSLCSMGQCFIFSAPNTIASYWFAESERTSAVAIGNILNQMGAALGFLMSPFVVHQDNYHDRFLLLVILQFVIAMIGSVPVLLCFESVPPSPPSPSAALQIQVKKQAKKTFWLNIRKQCKDSLSLLTNVPFWILLNTLGLIQGAFGAVLTLMDQLIEPKGFAPDDAGWFGFFALMAGIFMLVAGFLLDKTKRFSLFVKLNAIAMVIAFALFVVALQVPFLTNRAVIITSCVLMGAFANAAWPVFLETGVEVTFPVPEAISSAYQISATQIYGIVMTMLFGKMYEYDSLKPYTLWCCLAVLVFAAVSAMVFCGEMKRYKMEQEELKKEQARAKAYQDESINV